jgi:hypothetical protein
MIAMWDHAPAVNWIASLVMALPAALVGGWLFARQSDRARSRVLSAGN